MRKDKTFRDVARVAQVSIATVSRVATGSARVSSVATDRVRKVAGELGIDLNRKNNGKVIGFVLSNREMLHPYHSRLLAGTAAYCQALGYAVLYLPIHYDPKGSWRDIQLPEVALREGFVDGFIVSGAISQNLLDFLIRRRLPCAVLGNQVIGEWDHTAYDTVWMDDDGGAYEATRYLQSLGHTNIWYVGNLRLPWFARRYEGYFRAMAEASLGPLLSDIDADKDLDIGYLGMKSILNHRKPVSAVFAPGDVTAQGVYKALGDCGLRIPQDVSVVGFNDIEAGMLDPPLTTVRVFAEHISKKLAEMVIARSEKPELGVQRCSIPTQLVKRASSREFVSPAARGDGALHRISRTEPDHEDQPA